MKCFSTRLVASESLEVHSWEPELEIGLDSVDLNIPIGTYATGWNHAIGRNIDCRIRSCRSLRGGKANVVSIPIGQCKVSTRSFSFATDSAEGSAVSAEKVTEEGPGPNPVRGGGPVIFPEENIPSPSGPTTRIRIPPDAIKLEDRLHYLLQPSLESLLDRNTFELPFEPFPYQYEGVGFLYGSHTAILADEMGLGKTMQAIVTTRLLLRSREIRNALLVCPKPLVTNWKREFELWAPELGVQVIEGTQERRKWLWQLDDVPVRIANYELLHRDQDFYDRPSSAGGSFFDLVILDESQRIKNQASATSKAARAIPHKRSWALTGTPVENSPEDLVGIFEFLSPGFLARQMKPSQMSKLVGDYILRRTKDKVLTDLPPKTIRDAEIALSPEQQETYDKAEDEGVLRLSAMGEEATIQHVFELVLRLKQICNFDPATGESAKLERLRADLEEVAESGRKAIVFSQWVHTLTRLKEELIDFHPVEYHGKIPSKQRDGVIERFRNDSDCHVILMSYGAGSVGLNLQFAGYVFLFDRWWNPAIEDQAINRAHRIGADGPVTVTRFLSLGTIEQRIDRVLEEKRELFETILSGARGEQSTGMNQKEIFGLFDLKVPGMRKSA